MLPLRWLLFVALSVECVNGQNSILDYVRSDFSREWNEDLEPVLESFSRRMRKEMFPIVQEILYDEELPAECLQSLARLSSGFSDRRLWAMKFLDASGKPAAGMLEGQGASLGNYDECLQIRVPNKHDPKKIDFGGQYCTASVVTRRQPLMYRMLPDMLEQDPVFSNFLGDMNITEMLEIMERIPFGFRLGICLPSTCDSSLITHWAKKFGGKYGIQADVLACKDQLSEERLSTGTKISGIVIAVMVTLVIVGTIVDSYRGEESRGIVGIVQCFSARVAYVKVTSTKVAPAVQHLDCIYGIRVLSSFWILYSHTFGGDAGIYDNMRKVMVSMRSPVFVLIVQGMLAVETFFAITGILLYNGLRKEREKSRLATPQFALMILGRRALKLIVPSLGAMCLFYLFPLLTSGPAFDYMYPWFESHCNQRWWTIPLFINNFWTLEQSCQGNQWYNAVDMQCWCILILPVILMLRKPAKGLFIVLVLTIASCIYTAGLTVHLGATPSMVLLSPNLEGMLQFALRVHDTFFAHFSSMAVGLIGGYFIEHHRDVKLSKVLTRMGWVAFTVIGSSIILVAHVWHERKSITVVETFIYSGLYRPLWSLCIVWLVYMCSTGRAETMRWLLNRPSYMCLSRLSFCFYLMQLQVVLMKNFTARHLVSFTYYQNFRDFFADLIFNYLAACVLVVLFEAPATSLDRFFCGRPKDRTPQDITDEKIKSVTVTKSEDSGPINYKF